MHFFLGWPFYHNCNRPQHHKQLIRERPRPQYTFFNTRSHTVELKLSLQFWVNS